MAITAFTDIDIDVKNRNEILEMFDCTPALERINAGEYVLHKSGVFFDDIPKDPIVGCASIPYKEAELLGYQKIDFLNVHVYDGVRDRNHLKSLIQQEPNWELFTVPEIVGELFQLSNQITTTVSWAPTNVYQLAMLIAMIRPAKMHLISAPSWAVVEKSIWDYSTTNGKAYLKKPHAIAYAFAIISQLNSLVESLTSQ